MQFDKVLYSEISLIKMFDLETMHNSHNRVLFLSLFCLFACSSNDSTSGHYVFRSFVYFIEHCCSSKHCCRQQQTSPCHGSLLLSLYGKIRVYFSKRFHFQLIYCLVYTIISFRGYSLEGLTPYCPGKVVANADVSYDFCSREVIV